MVIEAGQRGICPHCKEANRFESAVDRYDRPHESIRIKNGKDDDEEVLRLVRCTHPNCGKIIIFFKNKLVYPLGSSRNPCPKEVPKQIAEDYHEACLVEHLSPKAAAALARRCLQNMLHEQGIMKQDLSEEIDEAMKILPEHLKSAIDGIRQIGKFAVHPIKSKDTSLIIGVAPGEAEWNLDVVEQLMNFYYVEPARTKEKRDALNAKLKEAGKLPMK